jgi:multidrug efflux pump subunit AcrA (membrane-fusion protein)
MLSDFTKPLRIFTGKQLVAGAALVLAGAGWFAFAHIGEGTPGHSEVSSQSRKGLQRYTPTPAEWATIFSPIAGTVVQRKIGPGQYVNAGASDPVFVIGDLLVKSGIIAA